MRIVEHITELDMNRISKKILKEQEIEEGIFDGITNMFQGIKGFWRGEGYDFFKYLSSLRNMVKDLKKLDVPNHKIMNKLTELKNKITSSTMPQEKKGQLVFEIDKALKNFQEYSTHIHNLEDVTSQRLKGIKTYTEKPTHGLEEPPVETNTGQSNLPVIRQPPTNISERRYRKY